MSTALQDVADPLTRQTSLASTFDRIVVINLARRPDRLERFSTRLEGVWPFTPPQRFEAVDGSNERLPPTWKKGAGAWGCLQSHRAVLNAAIADQVSSLLILEDDAVPVPDFGQQIERFLLNVPDDWNCLMLGAEHLLPPIQLTAGVVRCVASIRCHAYALRGPLMQMLSVFWQCNKTDHCDLVLSSLMSHYKTYAPDPLLFGQDAGRSDIKPRVEPLRFFTTGQSFPHADNPTNP